MDTLNPTYLILTLGIAIGATIGTGLGVGIMLWRGCKGLRNWGKALKLTMPDLIGTKAKFEWIGGNFQDEPSTEAGAVRGDMDRIQPSGPASYPTNWGPLHILSTDGFSLVAPSKLEAAKTIEHNFVAQWIQDNKRLPNKDESFTDGLKKAMADGERLAKRFLVWDPLAYWKKSRESVMQKLYHSIGGAPEPWYAKAAVVLGIIAVVGTLAVLGITVLKVLPALQAAGGS